MEGVPVGCPLFYSGKGERMSPCHCALRLRPDKQSPSLVALSIVSFRHGVCIQISVTDVIHKALTAVIGREGLCCSGRPVRTSKVAGSDHPQHEQACRNQSIRKIFLGLTTVVRLLPCHWPHYVVRYCVSGPANPVAEVYQAVLRSGKVVAPCELLLPILNTSAFCVLALCALKMFLLSYR